MWAKRGSERTIALRCALTQPLHHTDPSDDRQAKKFFMNAKKEEEWCDLGTLSAMLFPAANQCAALPPAMVYSSA